MNAGTITPPVTTENKTTAAYRIFPYSSAIFLYKKAFLATIFFKILPDEYEVAVFCNNNSNGRLQMMPDTVPSPAAGRGSYLAIDGAVIL
ncbi:hypothetical protein [Chitinophaga sp. Ak27]|nr:hypothetical protein [Chitinophaga sp. Ak27]NLU90312.1 hypothetical protein [Chitinophaga sp. Ak27]